MVNKILRLLVLNLIWGVYNRLSISIIAKHIVWGVWALLWCGGGGYKNRYTLVFLVIVYSIEKLRLTPNFLSTKYNTVYLISQCNEIYI